MLTALHSRDTPPRTPLARTRGFFFFSCVQTCSTCVRACSIVFCPCVHACSVVFISCVHVFVFVFVSYMHACSTCVRACSARIRDPYAWSAWSDLYACSAWSARIRTRAYVARSTMPGIGRRPAPPHRSCHPPPAFIRHPHRAAIFSTPLWGLCSLPHRDIPPLPPSRFLNHPACRSRLAWSRIDMLFSW